MRQKIKISGLFLLLLSLIFAMASTSGCEYPEFDAPSSSRTTAEITFTTARIERTSEADETVAGDITETDQSDIGKTLVPGYGRVVNVRTFVNIRVGAGLDQEIIGKARNDTEFTVTTAFYTDNWHQVLYENETAFIYADYFEVEREPYMADLLHNDDPEDADDDSDEDDIDINEDQTDQTEADSDDDSDEDDDFSDEQGVG